MHTADTLDTAKYAHIVGVFRDRAKADQAVEALMVHITNVNWSKICMLWIRWVLR